MGNLCCDHSIGSRIVWVEVVAGRLAVWVEVVLGGVVGGHSCGGYFGGIRTLARNVPPADFGVWVGVVTGRFGGSWEDGC